MIYTRSQMLAEWRLAHGYEFQRTECSIDTLAGLDVDTAFEAQMRQWYVALLEFGPVELLQPQDVIGRVKARIDDAHVQSFGLLPDMRRVLSVEITGAGAPVIVTDSADCINRAVQLVRNPYSVPGPDDAVAFVRNRRLYVVCRNCPAITSISAVCDPGEEVYCMNEVALKYMKTNFKPFK